MTSSVRRRLNHLIESLRRRFRPQPGPMRTRLALEPLESRDLLAVTVTYNGTTDSLTISADTADTLTVSADGTSLFLTAGAGHGQINTANSGGGSLTDDDAGALNAEYALDSFFNDIETITIVNNVGGEFTVLTINAATLDDEGLTASANAIAVSGALLTEGSLTLTAATGNLTLTEAVDGGTTTVLNAAAGNITSSGNGKITSLNLTANAKVVTLLGSNNVVNLAGNASAGSFGFRDTSGLAVGLGATGVSASANVTIEAGNVDTLTLNRSVSAGTDGSATLSAGIITQTAAGPISAAGTNGTINLAADQLVLTGTDTVTATNVNITTWTANLAIELGSADGAVLGIDDTDLNAISATTLSINANGTVNVTVAGNVDAADDATNLVLTVGNAAGHITVNKSLTANNLRIVSDDVTIDTTNGAIAGKQLEFRTFAAGTSINLGSAAGQYLSNAELQKITLSGTGAGENVLSFFTQSGTLTIKEDLVLTGRAETLSLRDKNGVGQENNIEITVTNLQATSSNGNVFLTEANVVSTIAGSAASFSFRSTLNLTVDKLAGTDAHSTTDTVAGITATGTVRLETANDKSITQSSTSGNGAISAVNLGARAGTGITLTDAANTVTGTFAARLTASGDIQFNNTDAGIAVGNVAGTGDITAINGVTSAVGTSNVTIVNSGSLSVQGVIQSDDAGDARLATVRLQATGGDITQTAAGVIQADELGARAKANIALVNTTAHDIGEFAAVTTNSGQIALFTDAASLSVGAVTADGTLFAAVSGISSGAAATNVLLRNSGGISVDQAIGSTQGGSPQLTAVYLNTTAVGSDITQTAAISADLLAATAADTVVLNAANVVDQFIARTKTGKIEFTNDDTADGSTLTIGFTGTQTLNGVTMYSATIGITSVAAVDVTVVTDEHLTVSQQIERVGDLELANVVLTAGNAASPEPAGNLTVSAQVRGLTVTGTTDGNISVGATGLVGAVSADGTKQALASLISSTGTGTLSIADGGAVSSTNSVTAANALTTLSAPGTVTISGTASSTGTTNVSSTAANVSVAATGSITGGTAVAVTGQTDVSTAGTIDSANGTTNVTATTGTLTQTAGTIDSQTGTTISASGLVTLAGTVDSDATTDIDSTTGGVTLSGTIGGDTGIDIDAVTDSSQTAGTIDSATGSTSITVTAGTFSQSAGAVIDSQTGTTLSASGLVTLAGTVDSDATTDIDSTAGGVTLSGTVGGDTGVDIDAAGAISQTAGTIDSATGSTSITSTNGTFSQTAGAVIDSQTGTTVGASGLVTLAGTVDSDATTDIDSTAGGVTISGTIGGDTGITIDAATTFTQAAGTIDSASGSTQITAAGILQTAGTIDSGSGTTLSASGLVSLSGTVDSDKTTSITSTTSGILQTAGTIDSGSGTTLSASGLVSLSGTVDSNKTTSVTSVTSGILQTAGTIDSGTGTTLSASGLVSLAGTVDSNKTTSVTSVTSGILQTAGTINSRTGTTLSASGLISLAGTVDADKTTSITSTAGGITQSAGLIDSLSGTTLNASGLVTLAGTVDSRGAATDITSAAGGITQTAGTIEAATNATLTAKTDIALAGNVNAGADATDVLTLTAGTGTVTQSAGKVTGTTLAVTAATGITLTQATNDVDNLKLSLTSGAAAYTDFDGLALGNITLGNTANPDVDLTVSVSGAVTIAGPWSMQIESTKVLSGVDVTGATTVTFDSGSKLTANFTDPDDFLLQAAIDPGYVLFTSNVAPTGTANLSLLIPNGNDTTTLTSAGGSATVGAFSVVFESSFDNGITLKIDFTPERPPNPPAGGVSEQTVQTAVQAVPAPLQQVAPPVEQEDFGTGGSTLAESSFLVLMFGEGDADEKFWVISSVGTRDGKEIVLPATLNGVELIKELRKAFGVKIAGQFGKYVIEIDDVTSAKDEQGKKLKSVRVRFSFNAETQDELLRRLQEIGDDKKKLFEFLQTLPEAQVLPAENVPSEKDGAGLLPAGLRGAFRGMIGTFFAGIQAGNGADAFRSVTDVDAARPAGPKPQLQPAAGRDGFFERDSAPTDATSSTLLGTVALGAVAALTARRTSRGDERSRFEQELDGLMAEYLGR